MNNFWNINLIQVYFASIIAKHQEMVFVQAMAEKNIKIAPNIGSKFFKAKLIKSSIAAALFYQAALTDNGAQQAPNSLKQTYQIFYCRSSNL